MTTEPDRYEVQAEIGKGGMGTVFRALDRKLQRQVALKRIHSNLAKDPLAVGRLQKEASLAATLEHPNIVRVYDVIRDDQGAFITMEHVSGESLADRLQKYGAMRPYQAQAVCQKVAQALIFAHSKGVIHLDVKPANILVAANSEPRLTDFGIATWTQEQGELTRELVGTPEYAAPELAKPEAKPDARADVYSLAATLYALLTGTSPHVIRESEIPKPFRHLILKAVSQDPAHRHPNMEAFSRELDSINPHQRSPWPLVAGLVGILFVAGLVGYLLFATSSDERVAPRPKPAALPVDKPIVRDPVTPEPVSGTIAPEPKAQAEFQALNVISTGRHTWAYGILKNTGQIPIEKPRVDLSFFDDQGTATGTGFAYAAADLLEPGMQAPVSVVVKGYRKPHTRHTATVQAHKLYLAKKRLARLSIHDKKLTKGNYGQTTFTARIQNDDSQTVKFAEAVVVFYDQQDRIIAVSRSFAKSKELPAGEDSPVKVRCYSPSREAPARYEVHAYAAVYPK